MGADQLSTDIPEPDRTWFALAAYNVGIGHLDDARILTRNNGRDPNRWIDVKDHLPLLSKKEWYSQTRYGYACGAGAGALCAEHPPRDSHLGDSARRRNAATTERAVSRAGILDCCRRDSATESIIARSSL